MPSILIRDISEETLGKLKGLAARHNRSLQQELRATLENIGSNAPIDVIAKAAAIRKKLKKRGNYFQIARRFLGRIELVEVYRRCECSNKLFIPEILSEKVADFFFNCGLRRLSPYCARPYIPGNRQHPLEKIQIKGVGKKRSIGNHKSHRIIPFKDRTIQTDFSARR